MNEIKVGIIGFGTVGAGVASCLLKNASCIEKRTGVPVRLHKIADLDVTSDRGVAVPDGILTTSVPELLDACDVVVELIGGTTKSKEFIIKALSMGKCVVTANKALLADFGEEIFAAAEKGGGEIYYEASVGGGIPIIKSLREGFVGNRINRMYGILNGTCNYILTRMERERLGFQSVLTDAQRLGYAEANPSLDIDGFDTAHKAAILASLAYGEWFGTKSVFVDGIRDLSLEDVKFADELGYKIKLLAIIKQDEKERVEVRVHPTLVTKSAPLAGISDVFNGVMVNGDFVGDTLFYGRGAGRFATASAVVSDIVDVSINLAGGCVGRLKSFRRGKQYSSLIPMDEIVSRYYLRIQVADKPGVLGKIATLLSNHDISIATVMQREAGKDDKGEVSIIILSHKAVEASVQSAVKEIEALPDVADKVKLIRIEDI